MWNTRLLVLLAMSCAAETEPQPEESTAAHQAREGLVGLPGGPVGLEGCGPGQPQLHPTCELLCDPNTLDPGTPGFCCDADYRSTCFEAGLYHPDDKDGDGIPDNADNCVYTPNPDQAQSDYISWSNNDDFGDACDNCPTVPNQEQYNRDDDAFGDACDDDRDGDGFLNGVDLCPDAADPLQLDQDGDGLGDACDPDIDGDGLANTGVGGDNCPLVANPGQENTDGDLWGDACDLCPTILSYGAQDADQNGVGDVCDWPPTFLDLAVVAPGTPQCSPDFTGPLVDCYDLELPPAPSIRRSFVPTGTSPNLRQFGEGRRLPEGWLDQKQLGDKVADLPPHRMSPDGRLSTLKDGNGNPMIEVFFPENLQHGMLTHPSRRVYSRGTHVPMAARYFPPISNLMDAADLSAIADDEQLESEQHGSGVGYRSVWADLDDPAAWSRTPHTLNWDLCEGDTPAPVPCEIEYLACTPGSSTACAPSTAATDTYQGQCYENTLLYTYNHPDMDPAEDVSARQWELRSVDTVVFVGSQNPVGPLHLADTNSRWNSPNLTLVFPREAMNQATVTNGVHALGAYDGWDMNRALDTWQRQTGSGSMTWLKYEDYIDMVADECTTASPPQWCRWADAHNVRRSFEFWNDPGVSYDAWDGEKAGSRDETMLEPATTEDGRLLTMNVAGSIRYSYNDGPDACSAHGFGAFSPLSYAHTDPLLENPDHTKKYGFANEPLRYPNGQLLKHDEHVPGSYPWISAAGEVLLWPMANTQFGWKPTWVDSGNYSFDDTSSDPDDWRAVQNDQLNRNTVSAVAVGSWTRGKIVHFDNMVNYSNFQGAVWDLRNELMQLPLYNNTRVFVQPRGTSLLNSPENSLAHVEAVAPISPFDVVWSLSSSAHQTGELVFDDYLNPRAYVVSHMNEELWDFRKYSVKAADGFVEGTNDPATPADESFQFAKSPTLQNASTVLGAPAMGLYGGAFIPPIAEGGVVGKGVFLDGRNDIVLVETLPTDAGDDFLVSLWLEAHELYQPRILMTFADTSVLVVADGVVEHVSTNGTRQTWAVPTQPWTTPRYTHYAVAMFDRGQGRQMQVFVDGVPYGERPVPGAGVGVAGSDFFGMAVGAIGNHSDGYTPVRGWIDELKVYGLLDSTVNQVHEVDEPFFAEWVCNQALGSLSYDNGQASCEQLDFRHSDPRVAPDNWTYQGSASLPIGDGLDFAMNAYTTPTCANQAHRTPDADCERGLHLGLPDLVYDTPRPDTSGEAFCLTCHFPGHPTPELGLDALTSKPIDVEDDPRRQPMAWPATAGGHLPHSQGDSFGRPGMPDPNLFGVSLDSVFLPSQAGQPPAYLKPRTP